MIVGHGGGALTGSDSTSFAVEVAGLPPDSYSLRTIVLDGCRNESRCHEDFIITANKKPTAICLSSLTIELTPMDLDNDGEIDTAMAVIQASEFDRSSRAACGSAETNLEFRIARDEGEVVLPEAQQITVGCAHAGVNRLRMFVLDENGQWDYCAVMLIVQENMGGCDGIQGQSSPVSVTGNPKKKVHGYRIGGRQASSSPDFVNDATFDAGAEALFSEMDGGDHQFVLYQNHPNPFHFETSIGFDLPLEGHVRLIIYDLTGKVLWKKEGVGLAGYNAWNIGRSQLLPQSGVLYYKLECQQGTALKKMVVVP